MEQPRYSLSVLERLCHGDIAGRLPWHVLKDDGLWLKAHGDMPVAEMVVVEWHPLQDEQFPALPVPFTAYELAAFMLAGGGMFLLEEFEQFDDPRWADHDAGLDAAPDWPLQLDEKALTRLGQNVGGACEAIREAHRLLRLSARRFGRDVDSSAHQAAGWLLGGADAMDAAEPAIIQRKAIQAMLDNERRVSDAIAAALKERGIDEVPAFKLGNKPDQFKTRVHELSGLGSGAFKHAWGAVTKGMRSLRPPAN